MKLITGALALVFFASYAAIAHAAAAAGKGEEVGTCEAQVCRMARHAMTPMTDYKVNETACKDPNAKRGVVIIVNLKRHVARRQAVEQRMHSVDWSLFAGCLEIVIMEAVDGRQFTNNTLQEMGVSLMPDYYDPTTGRAINAGEVGCSLSHTRAWTYIVERKFDYGIVFEDDARFQPNFNAQAHKLVNDYIVNGEYEWAYLARRHVRPQTEIRVESTIPGIELSIPKWSWWTIAYSISFEGARRLNSDMWRSNLFVDDEYLPVMLGTHHKDLPKEWLERFLQGERPLKAIGFANIPQDNVVQPMGWQDRSGLFSTSTEFNPPLASYRPGENTFKWKNEEFVLLSVAAEVDEPYLRFARSLAVYGIPYRVGGLGKPVRSDVQKVEILREMLKEFKDRPNAIVMYTDSAESILLKHPSLIMTEYWAIGADIVFSAESGLWPDVSLEEHFPSVPESAQTPYRFLCSQGFIGRAGALAKWLETPIGDDFGTFQRYHQSIFLQHVKAPAEHDTTVTLDYNATIFMTLGTEADEHDLYVILTRMRNKFNKVQPASLLVGNSGGLYAKTQLNLYAGGLAEQFRGNFYGHNHVKFPMYGYEHPPKDQIGTVRVSLVAPSTSTTWSSALTAVLMQDFPLNKLHIRVYFLGAPTEVFNATVAQFKRLAAGVGSVTFTTKENMRLSVAYQLALDEWAASDEDYLWSLEPCALITNPNALKSWMSNHKDIVGPMLSSTTQEPFYNFWGKMSKKGKFTRGWFDKDVRQSHYRGIWNVAMLEYSALIRRSILPRLDKIFYDPEFSSQSYEFRFATECNKRSVFTHMDNMQHYGHLICE